MGVVTSHRVEAHRQVLTCDCGQEMEATDGMTNSMTTTYRHVCPGCEKQEWHEQSYPRIIHRKVGQ